MMISLQKTQKLLSLSLFYSCEGLFQFWPSGVIPNTIRKFPWSMVSLQQVSLDQWFRIIFLFLMKNHVPYLYKGCFLCMPMDVDFNWFFLLQDFTARPDIADDCFLLASRCIRYCPHIFVLSSIFPSLVDCSMIGITIQHRYCLLFSIKI